MFCSRDQSLWLVFTSCSRETPCLEHDLVVRETCKHVVYKDPNTHTPLLSPTMKSQCKYQRNDSPADLQRSSFQYISHFSHYISISQFFRHVWCLAPSLLCLLLATSLCDSFVHLGMFAFQWAAADINNDANDCFFSEEVGIMIQLISFSWLSDSLSL